MHAESCHGTEPVARRGHVAGIVMNGSTVEHIIDSQADDTFCVWALLFVTCSLRQAVAVPLHMSRSLAAKALRMVFFNIHKAWLWTVAVETS